MNYTKVANMKTNFLIIANLRPKDAFILELGKLGVNTEKAVSEGRLLFLDAVRTLGELLIDGQPDWVRFERVIGDAMRKVQAAGPTGLRAYGEMVGLLWDRGEFPAARYLPVAQGHHGRDR